MTHDQLVPVIDIFAGPGGLGEGFFAFGRDKGSPFFRISLSIEKDHHAYRTLLLRSFFRQFDQKNIPGAYYDFIRSANKPEESRWSELAMLHPDEFRQAWSEVLRAELGKDDPKIIRQYIERALRGHRNFILIGGPPCQPYSFVGRSRNKAKPSYRIEQDERQKLYIEYLQVLADHCPAVFVFENVKGLLSATIDNQRIFHRILEDLESPYIALQREGRKVSGTKSKVRYNVFSLVTAESSDNNLFEYVVCMENYGVPQARHRVILLGIRGDLGNVKPDVMREKEKVEAGRVLHGLPSLRSGLSKGKDSSEVWLECIRKANSEPWLIEIRDNGPSDVYKEITEVIANLSIPAQGLGGEFVECNVDIDYLPEWYLDNRLGGVCNHSARFHMTEDIHRYLFSSCYTKVRGKSPRIKDFPKTLLPNHKSISGAILYGHFDDRFRTQLPGAPSTTVTSHLAKDGHYFIHPDPYQCRSMTVREVARLQTFPDNYMICGPRSSQYIQVGNAVPPLISREIAGIVKTILEHSGVSNYNG